MGVGRVFRVGGAQAVAAMAFGTETIPRVDVICGPGNAYVMEAKRQVYGSGGHRQPGRAQRSADRGRRTAWPPTGWPPTCWRRRSTAAGRRRCWWPRSRRCAVAVQEALVHADGAGNCARAPAGGRRVARGGGRVRPAVRPSSRRRARTSWHSRPQWSTPTRPSTWRYSWPIRAAFFPGCGRRGLSSWATTRDGLRRLCGGEQPRAAHRRFGPLLFAPVGATPSCAGRRTWR